MSDLEKVHRVAPYPFFREPDRDELSMLNKINPGWNRWQVTRSINPYIYDQDATGFEGYEVGRGRYPTEVAISIAQIGADTLQSVRRLHPYNQEYLRKLWRVAEGRVYDKKILADLNGYLMAIIGRLRLQILPQVNREGDAFRNHVATLVLHEHIEYIAEQGVVRKHTIALPKQKDQRTAIRITDSTFLNDTQREGYRFMCLLGRAGYPLVQLTIRRKPF